MSAKTKKNLAIAFGLIISVLMLLVLFYHIQWDLFLIQLKKINYFYTPVLIALFIISFIFRAIRWRYLLPSTSNFSILKLFSACILGMMATCILPLRAGEFVRPWVLSKNSNVSFSMAFSTVVTERVFDVLAMLTLLAISLNKIENPPALVAVGAKTLGIIAFTILIIMIFSYFKANSVINLAERILGFIFKAKNNFIAEKILGILREFILGLRCISSFKELLIIIFWSYLMWILFSFFYYLVIRSFGVDATLIMGNTVNVFVALAIAAPSAPGFIGTFQVGCVAALTTIYGLDKEFALAYSVFAHSLQYIMSIVLGLIMLNYEGLKFRELSKSS